MDNFKSDDYYIQKIKHDLKFIVVHMETVRNPIKTFLQV